MVKMNWNDGWFFAKRAWADTDPAQKLEGIPVTLPHTWYSDDDYYRGEAVYQKSFISKVSSDTRCFLCFDAADQNCRIYLNGKETGAHQGGYTRFGVELTRDLCPGTNLLTVLISNEKNDTISPLSGDFAVFGGISRNVEMIVTGQDCFDRTWYGTKGVVFQTRLNEKGEGVLYADAHVSAFSNSGLSISYTLKDNKGTVIASKSETLTAGLHPVLTVTDPVLWQGIRNPYLYTAEAVLTADGVSVDEVSLKVGFRSVAADPDRGFFLNGRHVKLHGAAKHQDTAEVFSAASEENWQTDMALIKEIGANAVRLSHYPHPQRIYDLADEMGIVVWSEIPLLKLTNNEALFENVKHQLTEMILQNMHHPSVCFWGIQNEIAIFGEQPHMPPKLRILRDLAHKLDDTRLVTCSNLNSVGVESELNRITDVTAYNIYYGWYYGTFADHAAFLDAFHAANPSMPLGISEYGADCSTAYHSEDPKVNDYTEEFQALYHETVYPMMAERDFVWGTFVWNMFDFVSPIRNSGNVRNRNLKGLVTHDRKTRKQAFYYYQAQWVEEPVVHFAEKRFVNRAGAEMTVKIYTNQPEVTLTAGDHVYTQDNVNGVVCFKNIPLVMGANPMKASAGPVSDEMTFVRCEEPDPSYIYVDQNPGLNVRNWFVDEQEEAKLFPDGFYSIRQKIEALRSNPEVLAVIDERMPEVGKDLRDTIGTFTLEQYFAHEKPDRTEDEIKELNACLISIPLE